MSALSSLNSSGMLARRRGGLGSVRVDRDGGATWERLDGITTEAVRAVAAPAKGQ